MRRICNFSAILLFSTLASANPIDGYKFTPPIRVACVGDSITSGAGADPGKFYPTQLQTMLGPTWNVRNFGVSGRTLLKKGDNPYWNESAYREALAFLPNVVIIMLGTNDTKPQNWRYFAEFESDYTALVDSFKRLPGHPTIYLCLPPPVIGPGSYNITEKNLLDEIPVIQKIAKEANVQIINIYGALDGKPQMIPDNVHPNNEGYGVMAGTIYQALTGGIPPSHS